MGGGSVLRGVARLMGAASVGAASAPPGAFCHVSSLNNPHDLDLPPIEACHASASPSKPLVLLRHDSAEEWECPAEEEWNERPRSHLVFAPSPTQEEVEEATKELHAALHLSIPLPSSGLDESSNEPSVCMPGSSSLDPTTEKALTVPEKRSPILAAYLGMFAARSSSVYQAFHLLQTNPQIQGAVKSLACDPAVWKAVLNNEKVQELTQSLQDGDEDSSPKVFTPFKEEIAKSNFCLKLSSMVYDYVTGKVLQLMDKIVEIVSNMFGSVENTFFSKEPASTADKTVASCMVLAVAVLLLVVVKRVAIK